MASLKSTHDQNRSDSCVTAARQQSLLLYINPHMRDLDRRTGSKESTPIEASFFTVTLTITLGEAA